MNGFINLNKHKGITSNKILGILKYHLRQMGFNDKIGHMGTLDPMAEGVLPVAIGRATRLFDYSLNKIKKYKAEFVLGASSDSLDTDTAVTYDQSFTMPSEEIVQSAIRTQIGEIDQIPPIYSAKSVHGVRAYKLARAGEAVVLQPKKVRIFDIVLAEISGNTIKTEITCSGGTYVRSIGRDIAAYLNTTAVMSALIRVKSGIFDVNNSISLKEIENNPQVVLQKIIPMEAFAEDFPHVSITETEKKDLLNGKVVFPKEKSMEMTAFFCEGNLIGMGTRSDSIHIKTWLL